MSGHGGHQDLPPVRLPTPSSAPSVSGSISGEPHTSPAPVHPIALAPDPAQGASSTSRCTPPTVVASYVSQAPASLSAVPNPQIRRPELDTRPGAAKTALLFAATENSSGLALPSGSAMQPSASANKTQQIVQIVKGILSMTGTAIPAMATASEPPAPVRASTGTTASQPMTPAPAPASAGIIAGVTQHVSAALSAARSAAGAAPSTTAAATGITASAPPSMSAPQQAVPAVPVPAPTLSTAAASVSLLTAAPQLVASRPAAKPVHAAATASVAAAAPVTVPVTGAAAGTGAASSIPAAAPVAAAAPALASSTPGQGVTATSGWQHQQLLCYPLHQVHSLLSQSPRGTSGPQDWKAVGEQLERLGYRAEEALALIKEAWTEHSPRLGDALRSYRAHVEGFEHPRFDVFMVGLLGLDAVQRLRVPGHGSSTSGAPGVGSINGGLASKEQWGGYSWRSLPHSSTPAPSLQAGGVRRSSASKQALPEAHGSGVRRPAGPGELDQNQGSKRARPGVPSPAAAVAGAQGGAVAGCIPPAAPTVAAAAAVAADTSAAARAASTTASGIDMRLVVPMILRLTGTPQGTAELMAGHHNKALGLPDNFPWTMEAVQYLKQTAAVVTVTAVMGIGQSMASYTSQGGAAAGGTHAPAAVAEDTGMKRAGSVLLPSSNMGSLMMLSR